MQARMEFSKVNPGAFRTIYGMEAYLKRCGLEASLLDLIKTRASQINGCAFCIEMHTREAQERGESAQRLYLLDAWRESPCYTARERAALEWTEAVTIITHGHVPDELYQRVSRHFTEVELVNLTLAVVTINGWNRLCISFRAVPGSYQAE